MPIITLPITSAGLALGVLVGLDGKTTAALHANNQPIPPPVFAQALIDSGSSVTAVAPSVLRQLPVSPTSQAATQTASGLVPVNLYEVSLSIVDPKSGLPHVVRTDLVVSELPTELADAGVLVGLDVLAECLLVVNGPESKFTLAL